MRKKVPFFELLFVFFTLFFVLGVSIYGFYTTSSLKEEINGAKKTIDGNESKIKQNDMYKRIDDYGFRLNVAKNLIEYKKYSIHWENFIQKLKQKLPDDITISTLRYSSENQLTISIVAPTEEKILWALAILQDMKYINKVDYTTIKEDKSEENSDNKKSKKNYITYSTSVSFSIDQDYLFERYSSGGIDEENVSQTVTGSVTSSSSWSSDFSQEYDL